MPSYVAFLRAINLGATRKVPMAELRTCLTDAGFADVDTYLRTGNVRVATGLEPAPTVSDRLEQVLSDRFGFPIPSIVLTTDELARVHDDARALGRPPYAQDDFRGRYVIFFKDAPTAEVVTRVAAYEHDLEQARVVGRAAHVWVAGGYSDAQIFRALGKVFEPGTNRTLKVVRTLTERWC